MANGNLVDGYTIKVLGAAFDDKEIKKFLKSDDILLGLDDAAGDLESELKEYIEDLYVFEHQRPSRTTLIMGSNDPADRWTEAREGNIKRLMKRRQRRGKLR